MYLIDLHPDEYVDGLHYYPSVLNLDRCMGICNTLHDLPNKGCVLNKTEDFNFNIFNLITGTNESKISRKYISCKCKCKLNGTKCNSNQKWDNNKCRC